MLCIFIGLEPCDTSNDPTSSFSELSLLVQCPGGEQRTLPVAKGCKVSIDGNEKDPAGCPYCVQDLQQTDKLDLLGQPIKAIAASTDPVGKAALEAFRSGVPQIKRRQSINPEHGGFRIERYSRPTSSPTPLPFPTTPSGSKGQTEE